ncbi:MAG TPA: DUF1622 domain-containing protein [Candidatus Pacebacteria bacterium]|nr:DUF1622 domain-containing protein [Candidatus Paceibacterota bacterium]HIP33616.1 DUF1622 domain-containing protein [Bacteroidia bacterium]
MEILKEILDWVVFIIGFIGILVILIGTIKGFWMFLRGSTFWEIRLVLVKHILLGLDFLIGRDIIETVLLKTDKALWIDLAILVLIIIIRVVFSYFTTREMEQLKEEHNLKKL